MFGHPKGLFYLFFTEMWERFSFYGMRALLVLYLVNDQNWTRIDALTLLGTYMMSGYVVGIFGGIAADKFLGAKKAVLYGGILLSIGHGILALEGDFAFYAGLTGIVLGVGLLKPNISTMVGGLYKKGEARRDKGFYIFYIGINTGSLFGALLCGYVGKEFGYHGGFGLAGIGMVLGLIVYLIGQKHLKDVGNFIPPKTDEIKIPLPEYISSNKFESLFGIPLILFGAYYIFASSVLGGVLILLAGVLVFPGYIVFKSLNNIEKDRVKVLLLTCLVIVTFWAAYEQASGLMNLYADKKTDRVVFGHELPAAIFQGLTGFYIMIFSVMIANFWDKRKKANKETSTIYKMAYGHIIMGFGFVMMVAAALEYEKTGTSGLHWLFLAYFFHVVGELCSSPSSLSFMTKLAPARFGSIMMGIYFAAIGLGNKVASEVGKTAETFGEFSVFGGIFIFSALFGLALILLLKRLKGMTHGVEDEETFAT